MNISRSTDARQKGRPLDPCQWWVNRWGYETYEEFQPTGNRLTLKVTPSAVTVSSRERVSTDYAADYWAPGMWVAARRCSWAEEEEEPWERPNIYDPTQVTGLHRIFLEEPGYKFVERFGFLGDVLQEVEDQKEAVFWAEETRMWVQERATFQWMVHLYDTFRQGDTAALDTMVTLRGGRIEAVRPEPVWPIDEYLLWQRPKIVAADVPLGEGEDRDKALKRAVRRLLEVNLDEKIGRTCRPVARLQRGALLGYAPRTLLGAIYLQFLWEITGHGRDSQQCPQCGRWFVPSHGRQLYCQHGCNLKAYRLRKKQGEQDGNEA